MIGRCIVGRLLATGSRIRVLTRRKGDAEAGVEPVIGSLGEPAALAALVDGADAVFHCAAEINDSARMDEVNIEGTVRLSEAAAAHKVSYFCHISSAGVVGPGDAAWVDEDTPCRPASPYERSKWEAERRVRAALGAKAKLCILRPTNVVDEARPGVLALALRNGWKEKLVVRIKGAECAHVVHADDVAAAALHFWGHALDEPGWFFVASDEDVRNTVAGVYAMCRTEILGVAVGPPTTLPASVPYLVRRVLRGASLHGRTRFSTARLRAAGFEAPLGLAGAVRQICDRSLAAER